MKENDDPLEREPYRTILENIPDSLGRKLYTMFCKKYGPDFDGEGHVGHNEQVYWVRKDGHYRLYDPDEKLW